MPPRDPNTGRFLPRGASSGDDGGGNNHLPSWVNSLNQRAREIPNALQSYANDLRRAGGGVLSALGNLGRSIMSFGVRALGFALTALVGIVGGLIAAIRMSVNTAKEWGRSLALLRANTGIGFRQGYGIASKFGLFGIGPGEVTSMAGGSALGLQLRGGLNGDLAGMAEQYQRTASHGPVGRDVANSMLNWRFGGQASDQVRLLMNMRPQAIREQVGFGQKFDAGLKLNPELLSEYSEKVMLLQYRIGYMVDRLQLLFAVKLLPAVERGLGGIANFISNNIDTIVDVIGRVAKFLVADFPPMILRFGARVADGLGTFLDGTALFLQGMAGQVPAILRVFDAILNGIREFARQAAGIAAALAQGADNLINSPLGQRVQQIAGANPAATAAVVGGGIVATGIVGRMGFGAAPTAGRAAGWAGRGILGLLGRGAGIAVGGSTLGAYIGAGAVGAAGGIAAGYGLYRLGQHLGWIDPEQGFSDRMSTGWGRLRARVLTGDASNYDREVQGQWAQDRAMQMSQARFLRQHGGQTPEQVAANRLIASQGGMGPYLPQPGRSPQDARLQALAAFDAQVGRSNLAGNPTIVGNLQNYLNGAAGAASSGGTGLHALSKNLGDKADGWDAETKKIWEDIRRNTGETAKNTNDNAKNAKDLITSMPGFIREMTARIGANIATDVALSTLR